MYFICSDPKSELLSEIVRSPNVRIHDNKEGKKLSIIVNNILQDTNSKNINIIADEYDGENLDKREAEILNGILEENLQDKVVFLVSQSMEKERNVSIKEKSEKENKNMFHILKTMKQVDLNIAMRNSVQINNLICVTQTFLEGQPTIYQYPRDKDASKDPTCLSEKSSEEVEVSESYSKPKETNKRNLVNMEKASTSGERNGSQVRIQEHQNVRKFEDGKVPHWNVVIEKVDDKCTYKSTEDIERKISSGDESNCDAKNQEQGTVRNLELDEVFAVADIPRATTNDKNRIVNRFRYIASTGTGHNVHSCYPKLFEIDFHCSEKDSFEKLFVVNCTFKKLNIWNSNSNNKHAILHFDTSTDEIPKLLAFVIEYLKISNKVTCNYEDFKYNKSKSILVCSFRLFRGLEHSNVTIFIDQDIYCVQHYLVEAMARCTNSLALVVLHRSDTLSRIIAQWEKGFNGQQLIDHWKIKISKGGKKKVDYQEDEKLNLITVNGSSKNHEKMQETFDHHRKENHAWDITNIAEELIRKR